MNYWLMKSEPDAYSIHDLAAEPDQTDYWDGIRNYQVRNFMRDDMKVGDKAFFYHSSCAVPGIVGTMRIVKEAYTDHTAFDPTEQYYDSKSNPDEPRWVMVDVQLDTIFPEIITLTELRKHEELAEMRVLQKGNRLSITPVAEEHWNFVMFLATGK